MTLSKAERRFQKLISKFWVDCLVWKVPDYKQGVTSRGGLPDFFVLYQGFTFWFEVKYVTSKKTFNFSEFTESQLEVFKHFLDRGIDVYIVVFNRDFKPFMVPFSVVYRNIVEGKTSVYL